MAKTAKHTDPVFTHDLRPERTSCLHCGRLMRADYTHHRWTLDTPEDARLLRLIFDELVPEKTGWRDALAIVAAHPGWERINAAVVQRRV